MAKRPKSGKALKEPVKSLKQSYFYFKAYACDGCFSNLAYGLSKKRSK